MFDFKGRKVLVTGSSQGIGKAVAAGFAKQGAEVFVHASSSMDKARAVAAEMAGKVIPVVLNLCEEKCAKKLYEQTGEIDILVLNASVQYRKAWDEITSGEFDTQIKVNLKSSLELIQIYGKGMKSRGYGRIITVGSVQQYKPHKDMAVYAATKAAQMNLVTNLAKQLAPFGVTVNNMAPGVIATPRNDAALSDREYSAKVMEGIPCRCAGRAEDCVGAVLLLASDEGRYITGIDLIVDGGMHL